MQSTDLNGYVPLTVQVDGTGSGTVTATGLSAPGRRVPASMPAFDDRPGRHGGLECVIRRMGGRRLRRDGLDLYGDPRPGDLGDCDVRLEVRAQPRPATAYDPSAGNLSNITAIDTHNLTINGAAPLAGVKFSSAKATRSFRSETGRSTRRSP